MRVVWTSLLTLLVAACIAVPASPPIPGQERARELMEELGLEFLEGGESGYLALIGSSRLEVIAGEQEVKAQSQVYYMLTRDFPVNFLHWLSVDDTHILIEGGPVDYYVFRADGCVNKLTLGTDVAAGQRPVLPVPAGSHKALVLRDDAPYALMANVLSPQWTEDSVEVGGGREFLDTFAGKAAWASRDFLRFLIGPNWTDPASGAAGPT